MTIAAAIQHFGRVQPDADALVEGDRVISWGELAALVARTASHLSSLGVRPGDRVGVCMTDSADHLVVLLALAHVGAVSITLDWRAPPAENARLIDGLGLALVLIDKGARSIDSYACVALDAAWRRQVAGAPTAPATFGWNAPLAIFATSGSTGRPKLTLMSHAQYYLGLVGVWELNRAVGRQRFLSTLPLYFAGSRNCCLAHLLRGDAVVLYSNLFGAEEYAEIIAARGITTTTTVPSVVRQLLASGGEGLLLPGLTSMFCAGAPLHPQEKLAAARHLTPHFHERYGTAETLAISVLHPEDFAERATSVGRPHSLAQIEIVDDNHQALRTGEAGQLRLRAPGMGGPLPHVAAEARFRDGWFYPGEIARLDGAGYIYLEGRASDVIIRGGAKIHPAEVEAVLAAHPSVVDAAVVGQGGPGMEERAVAFVVARGDLGAGALVGHCRARLTPHKIPQAFYFVAALPRNTAGKVDRAALRATLAD